jgi:L-lactate dehydrogenase complex protein LldF
VYRKIGGHNYPWVYSGPIGAIITPQFHGTGRDPWLPYASSLCGACAEVCPVKIDIPKLLLDLRSDVAAYKEHVGASTLERLAFWAFAFVMRRPRLYEYAMRMARTLAPQRGGWISGLRFAPGPLKGWLTQRHLPAPAPKSFRELWRQR